MTCCRDYQKSKVYAWENQFPNGEHLSHSDIPAYVKKVWEVAGLKWPPLVETLHGKDQHLGKANRHYVYFSKNGAAELTILHKLAHTMTSTIHNHTDAHGPQFVGVFMRLLVEHLNIPLPLLLFSAQKAGIDFDIYAQAWSGA